MDLNVKSFLMVGLIAVLFIVIAKVVFTKFPIKGVSEIIQAV